MTDHEAGRALDALIAEKVMGWERHPSGWWGQRGREFLDGPPNWSPSTDIAAAWQVVEKVRQLRDGFYCEWIDSQDLWAATFLQWLGPKAQATADTAPLAICRAALKAMNYPNKEK